MKIAAYFAWLLVWFLIHSFLFASILLGESDWLLKAFIAVIDVSLLGIGMRVVHSQFAARRIGQRIGTPAGIHSARPESASAHFTPISRSPTTESHDPLVNQVEVRKETLQIQPCVAAVETSMKYSVGPNISQEADELLWSQALDEFEGPSRRSGLWAKAFAESDGNESGAKARYLQERMRQLMEEHVQRQQARAEAPAHAEQQEISRCIAVLSDVGYRVTVRSGSWEIREPLGGRLKISTLTDLTQYANERRRQCS